MSAVVRYVNRERLVSRLLVPWQKITSYYLVSEATLSCKTDFHVVCSLRVDTGEYKLMEEIIVLGSKN